jgi:hypothetical protein
MRCVDVAGVSYASGGPGEAYYACAPYGEGNVAFLMFEGCSSFWNATLGRAARALHAKFYEVAAASVPDLRTLAIDLHEQLFQEGHYFCSMVVGLVDAERQEMEILNAGHGGAFLRREKPRQVDLLPANGPVLGVRENFEWSTRRTKIHVGDLLMITNSGVVETTNEERQDFGEDGIREVLSEDAPGGGAARAWVQKLFHALEGHGKPYATDPVALALVLRRSSA